MTCKMPGNATRETFKHLNAKKQRHRQEETERGGLETQRERERERGSELEGAEKLAAICDA